MIIEKVELANFRNHRDTSIVLSPGVNVLVGKNAQGKTNLLEAVFLTCVGRGWRTHKDKDMINFAADAARVRTVVARKFGQVAVEVNLSRNTKKTIKINSVPVQRMGELMGQVNCVFFSPDELRLVKDAPADRRRFLDIDISQIDKAYFYGLLKYNKILLQRNSLLKSKTEDIESGLDIWDMQLANVGAMIIARRMEFVGKLAEGVANVHGYLANGAERISVEYEGCCGSLAQVVEIEGRLLTELKQAREKDMRLRTTTVGPHRDDLRITIDEKDVRHFASQGQQRTVALSLKLAELEIFREATGEMPVLLLDDVFSELDSERQGRLVKALAKCQSIVTAVEFPSGTGNVKKFKIENGAVVK
jgi:DNA replication and repair protein RecF